MIVDGSSLPFPDLRNREGMRALFGAGLWRLSINGRCPIGAYRPEVAGQALVLSQSITSRLLDLGFSYEGALTLTRLAG